MNAVVVILIAVLLAGCASDRHWHVASDSGAAASLGVTADEWREIQALAAEEKGWIPDAVVRIRKDLVAIRFIQKEDDFSGIVRRYQKKEAKWTKTGFSDTWSVTLLP